MISMVLALHFAMPSSAFFLARQGSLETHTYWWYYFDTGGTPAPTYPRSTPSILEVLPTCDGYYEGMPGWKSPCPESPDSTVCKSGRCLRRYYPNGQRGHTFTPCCKKNNPAFEDGFYYSGCTQYEYGGGDTRSQTVQCETNSDCANLHRATYISSWGSNIEFCSEGPPTPSPPTPVPTPPTPVPTPVPTPPLPDVLKSGQQLDTENSWLYLRSDDGVYKAVLQGDGNFVIFEGEWHPIWDSGTAEKGSPPYKAVMQDDGNFVIYDTSSDPLWSSQTGGKGTPPYSAVMQGDGNFVIYDSSKALWSSKHGILG